MSSLGLRGKLYFVAAVVVIGFAAFGLLAFDTLRTVQVHGPYYRSIVQSKDVIADILPPPEYIIETHLTAFEIWAEPDAQARTRLVEHLAALEAEYHARHEFWQRDLPPGDLKSRLLVDSYEPAVQYFQVLHDRFLPAIQRGDRDAAAALLAGPLKELYGRHRAAVDRTVELAIQRNEDDERAARAVIATRTALMLALGVGTGAGLLAVFALLARAILRPIRRIVAGLTTGAAQMSAAAAQVASTAQVLAAGASEQASSLEKTSTALEQVAAMARANATKARQANEFSDRARAAAQAGDGTMMELGRAMAGVNESSARIGNIVKVIEEIAFQTNLLALNAAVEAARAGEHGKGFAVVAEEVRNLAQRAAQASREVTALVEDSVARARQGATVSQQVVASLGAILADATQVADLVSGITRASEEQARGLEQVHSAVGQMDKVTQQSAAGAEESAASAEQLAAQAAAVKAIVAELVGVIMGRAGAGDAETGTVPATGEPTGGDIHAGRAGP